MFESLKTQALLIAQQLANDPTPKVATNLLGFDDQFLVVLRDRLPTVEVVGLPGVTVADIQAVNATDADVFVLNTVYAGCTSLAASLTELGIAPTVYANICNPIDGWYQTDLGFDPTDPDLDSGALAMTTLLEDGGYTFSDQDAMLLGTRNAATILTLVQQINELGPSVTPETLDAALRSRTKQVMFGFGELDCAPDAVPAGRRGEGSCVQFVDVWRGTADSNWTFDRVVDLRAS